MDENYQRVVAFIEDHHVMSLATSGEEGVHVCSLFYVFNVQSQSFIVASSQETQHIKDIEKNSKIAGNILLETDKIGEIKGLQFRGEFLSSPSLRLQGAYFKKYPYALAMVPTLWEIKLSWVKLTDNSLGFGKKIELAF